MTQFKIKITLGVFKGLMSVKRALTFLFLSFGRGLEGFGRILAKFLIFPFYNFYSRWAKVFSRPERIFGRREMLAVFVLLAGLVFAASESKAYANNKFLEGQQSLLYSFLGPAYGEEVLEEGTEDAAKAVFPSGWGEGALVSPIPQNEEAFYSEETAGTLAGGEAILPPTIMPGGEIGGQRYKIIKYIVQPGDTLSSIAQSFRIRLETILTENKLTARSLVRPGDSLNVLPVNGVSHTVKKGDTLKKIASLYQADAQKIKDFNRLGEDSLAVGEILIVPDGKKRAVVVSPPSPAPAAFYPTAKVTRPGMIWPTVSRRITQYFSWRHPGIDIGLPKGNPVYAAEGGVVEIAGWNSGGYGYQVVINHGGNLKTRYAHNSKNLVLAGQRVEKGEVIALIGSTGRSTGPHLHFEVMAGGGRVNPFLYVR